LLFQFQADERGRPEILNLADINEGAEEDDDYPEDQCEPERQPKADAVQEEGKTIYQGKCSIRITTLDL
jgi:hypothetical protein